MKILNCIAKLILLGIYAPFACGQLYEKAVVDQIYEITSIDKKPIDSAAFNALSNATELAIWSLAERKNHASSQALISLIEVQLGESHSRDRDCAILKNGEKSLPFLKQYALANELHCSKRAREIGYNVKAVCVGLDDAKKTAQLLSLAIKKKERCTLKSKK